LFLSADLKVEIIADPVFLVSFLQHTLIIACFCHRHASVSKHNSVHICQASNVFYFLLSTSTLVPSRNHEWYYGQKSQLLGWSDQSTELQRIQGQAVFDQEGSI